MDRRAFLARTAAVGAATVAGTLGPKGWGAAFAAAPAADGESPYGALQPSDENGIQLPEGFRSRIVAVSGSNVDGSDYAWHRNPDGAATFPMPDGGWTLAVNSEAFPGGVGVVRFAASGEIRDAYRILDGTIANCAGGATPWGTWLSCEEAPEGRVWECDPAGPGQGIERPALGTFFHEAVAVDAAGRQLYLTEDQPSGYYYRFTPTRYPDLSAGRLEVAALADEADPDGGRLVERWIEVADPTRPTRGQVDGATTFNGGEGIWHDPHGQGWMYFTTKGDNRVWAHDLDGDVITPVYDGGGVLRGVDNIVVAPSGDLLVAEDGGNLELVLITADTRAVAPFLRLPGPEHAESEIAGPCFTPDGTRLYVNSQRGGPPGSGGGTGITFEITGPFRRDRVGVAATGPVPPEASPSPVPSPSPLRPTPTSDPGRPSSRSDSPPAAISSDSPVEEGGEDDVPGWVLALGGTLAALGSAAVVRRQRDPEASDDIDQADS